ncbi:hypothetical protein KKH27_00860 [bacterium]|nr:hypothetical protein [bacterium]
MKPIRTVLISLLTLASATFAQPWQWQLYEGDFYNPTGFFDPPPESVIVGDFNGDGVDEVIWVTGSSFQMAERDLQTGHWSVASGSFPTAAGRPVWTGNLDTDPADELLTLGPHFFNATSDNPWTWEEFTPEPGIVQVCSTPWIGSIILGDYDSDGRLNAVTLSGWGWGMVLTLLEQNESGAFVVETSFDSSAYTALFDGDFDHDGDIDFATACESSDIPATAIVGENTPGGLVVHEYQSWDQPFSGPTGGDLDGDGQWEGLFRSSGGGYGGYRAYIKITLDEEEPISVSCGHQG